MGTVPSQTEESLTYECPHCKSSVDVLERLLGETIECPVCDRPFVVKPPAGRVLGPEEAKGSNHTAAAHLPVNDEHVEKVIRPVVFRRHFFGTVLFAVLALVGVVGIVAGLAGFAILQVPSIVVIVVSIGLLVLGGYFLSRWYLASRMHSLTLTNERLIYKHGIIKRASSELRYEDIRNLKLDQSLVERLLNFGDLALSSSGQDEMEIIINDIPNPTEVADYIRQRQD